MVETGSQIYGIQLQCNAFVYNFPETFTLNHWIVAILGVEEITLILLPAELTFYINYVDK